MLKDLVLQNRSYRSFDENYRFTQQELVDLVDYARFTASSINRQPLKYVLIWDRETVYQMLPYTFWAKALPNLKLPREGSRPTAFIVICHDLRISSSPHAFLRDIGIVAQTILLAATEKGLGGCMLGGFQEQKIAEFLKLPDYFKPVFVLALGKPSEQIILTEAEISGDTNYYRDLNDIHYVPKRPLDDLIIKCGTQHFDVSNNSGSE